MLQKSVIKTTRSWDSHPGGFLPRCAHWVRRLTGGQIPLQRSACDYAEVSLSLCTCHRLPQVAILILTHPRYRSPPFGRSSRGRSQLGLEF